MDHRLVKRVELNQAMFLLDRCVASSTLVLLAIRSTPRHPPGLFYEVGLEQSLREALQVIWETGQESEMVL